MRGAFLFRRHAGPPGAMVEEVAPLLPLVQGSELRPERLVEREGGDVDAASELARRDLEGDGLVPHDREVLA